MKALVFLFILHLVVCSIFGYAFGEWREGESRMVEIQNPNVISHDKGRMAEVMEGYTDNVFTVPRALLIYGVAGFLGIIAAFAVEIYRWLYPPG